MTDYCNGFACPSTRGRAGRTSRLLALGKDHWQVRRSSFIIRLVSDSMTIAGATFLDLNSITRSVFAPFEPLSTDSRLRP